MALSILHLSDFHTGKDDYGQITLFETILNQVRIRCGRGAAPNIVLISGDIANRGLDREYQLFAQSFLGPLREVFGTGSTVPVFLVPGNHDVDRTQCPTTISYAHAEDHLEYFDPTPQGIELRRPSFPRFAAYHRFLESANIDDQGLDGERSFYATELVLAGTKVGVVGLNSAWLSQDPEGRGTLYGGKGGHWEERECLTPGISAVDAGLSAVSASDVTLVVCHHPVSWFRLEEQGRLRASLGQHRVLLFHGHLHRTQSRLVEGAGLLFRSMQAGAAFQTRADSMWRNRFSWYEVEEESLEVMAEPLTWDADQRSWVVDGDAFQSSYRQGSRWRLPGLDSVAQTSGWVPPSGCVLVTEEYLASIASPLSDQDLATFFDGAIPTWRHILCSSVPRRTHVSNLVTAYSRKLDDPGGPMIRLITGAGGEGKSTVLLQTAAALVRATRPWRVMFLASQDSPLTTPDILALPTSSTPWLVVADDAENVAKACADAARALWDAGRRDVHFLLAARDTDWRGLGADKRLWHEFSDFAELRLRGLSVSDSEAIVAAWQLLGERGLGRLAQTPEADRATALRRAVHDNAARPEGSFFGGALELRLGEGLRDHVRGLLDRLRERTGTGTSTLMDALLLVAAPHSINILTLTPDILAEALGAKPIAVRQHILMPLGDEAAAVQSGRFVLTRHRAVAQAVMEIAAEHFGVDEAVCFEALVRSALRLRPTRRMPGFNDFCYLSRKFREELDRPDVAVRLACVLALEEPMNRHYLEELGVCCGQAGLYEENVCACLASVADYRGCEPPLNDNAKKALAAIGLACGALRDRRDDQVFAQGVAAVVNLGFRLALV